MPCPHSGATGTVHMGATLLHVQVSVTTGLRHVMKKSPQSQQDTLGDTRGLPLPAGLPIQHHDLGCSHPVPSRRPCSTFHSLPNGGTYNSLVSI